MKQTIPLLILGLLAVGCGKKETEKVNDSTLFGYKPGWTQTILDEQIGRCVEDLNKTVTWSTAQLTCECVIKGLARRVSVDEVKSGTVSQDIKQEVAQACKG